MVCVREPSLRTIAHTHPPCSETLHGRALTSPDTQDESGCGWSALQGQEEEPPCGWAAGRKKGRNHRVSGVAEELCVDYHLILSPYNLLRRSASLAPFYRQKSKGPERFCHRRGRTRSSLTLQSPPIRILSPQGSCGLPGIGTSQWAFPPWPHRGLAVSMQQRLPVSFISALWTSF